MSYKNPIIGNEYEKFVLIMLECARKNKLPQLMEIKDISEIKLSDVSSFLTQFISDTGLSMEFSAELCPNCNRLHAFLIVDYPDDNDVEGTLLN